MLKSMTGFGKAVIHSKGKKITVEIRSLNSKQFDLNLRIPFVLKEKENEIRSLLSKECERGKIDFSVSVEYEKGEAATVLNKKLAKEYFFALKSLAKELKTEEDDLLEIALKMPDVLKPEQTEFEMAEWKAVKSAIETALKDLNKFRSDEGKSLQKELEKNISQILFLLNEINILDKKRIPALREKLKNSIAEFKAQIDENRFEQELIFYIEKMDITEEKVRLKTHCDYFLKTIKEESSGRKLNFISQEIGREINTIGSKANHAEIQKSVVQMKDELEKIKEQLNNVL